MPKAQPIKPSTTTVPMPDAASTTRSHAATIFNTLAFR